MMNLNKLTNDYQTYPHCPLEHRWIYNKLSVAEAMGYNCGPCGMEIQKEGYYCIRPIMNFLGNGEGGVLKFHAIRGTNGKIIQPEAYAGYFWCEWFKGWQGWTDFTNDISVFEHGAFELNDRLILKFPGVITYKELPEVFKGISKYMLVEHIGGHIIEVAPRHTIYLHPHNTADLVKQKFMGEDEEWYRWVVTKR